MATPDLNLLVTLDVLLDEGSVVGAARRLQLSASAMSRALARLREATGDPLLVRAGRGLVPTPRALALRERVHQVVGDAEALLRPELRFDLATLDRSFRLRSSEGFVETFGPRLIARVAAEAPHARLWFLSKQDKDSAPLREGSVDLETGVLGRVMGPEILTLGLFEDRFVAVVRKDHALARGRLTPQRYAAAAHVLVSRRGLETGPIDDALARQGLSRQAAATVSGFAAALALARDTDLVATVPAEHTRGLWQGLQALPLPVPVPAFTISLFWHPRMDADPAHRWLRGLVQQVCRGEAGASNELARRRRRDPEDER